jgi:hypothetical protein
VEKIKGLGNITDAEKALIAAALPELAINIKKVSSISSILDLSLNSCQGVAFVEVPKL